MKIKKKTIKAVAIMMRALANETRLEILYSLYDKSKTWTELLFELQVNPKSLRDHLRFLEKNGLVKKAKDIGFELTEAGRAFIELSLKDIINAIEQVSELVKK